jgi:endo-1,4-beta-mannosidase
MAYWYSWLGSYWNQPTVARDLEYVHGLGINCIRVFGSLDQITTFDDVTGFSSFNQTYVQRLDTFLNEVCEPIGLKVLLVIFNRGGGTECDSLHSQMPWQFQTRALTHDGKYATMRTNYLQMIDSLAIRYASNPVIAGYDIMNEGIGGLANDTVSVQSAIQFFNDCYTHLKAHDTLHPVTVSSTLANSRSFMNLTACTDFYDIHIYRSHPEWVSDNTLNLAGRLKPVIIGETMSSYTYKTNADSLYIGLRNIYQDAWTYGFESVFAWDFSTEDVMMLRNANGTHTLGVGGEFVANFEKRFR